MQLIVYSKKTIVNKTHAKQKQNKLNNKLNWTAGITQNAFWFKVKFAYLMAEMNSVEGNASCW